MNRTRAGLPGLIFAGLIGVAAVNFGLQLGSSSYFVDEVLSIDVSAHPLGSLMHAVSHLEITPPAYFFLQHEWMARLGSQAEWVTRLPSLVFGVSLVAAVYWLATVVSNRHHVAVVATALAAFSPLLLQYSRLAQGYMLAALLVTLGVAAVLRAETVPRRSGVFCCLGIALAIGGLCVNYTAAIPIAMMCVWLLLRGALTWRWRLGVVASLAVVQLALLPLFIIQSRNAPGRAGVGAAAGVTWANLESMVRLPFYGPSAPWAGLGVAVTLTAIATLAIRGRRLTRATELVLTVAVGEPALLFLLSAFGARVAIVRYALVAAPFAIVAIAMGLARWPRSLALIGLCAAAVACGSGLAAGHRQSGFYPDTRGTVEFIQAHRHLGDAVISPDPPGYAVPLAYYGLRLLRPVLPYAFSGSSQATSLLRERRRLWIVSPLAGNSTASDEVGQAEEVFARRFGYRVSDARVFPGLVRLAVALWSPVARPKG